MKSIVLFSGGLDSTYNLWVANRETEVLLALTFNYGQRAAQREIAYARATCDVLGVPHKVVDLPWFGEFTTTSLVSRSCEVPQGDQVQIDEPSRSAHSAQAVWVPNRNGIFLNIAAGFAEGLGAEIVVPGFNLEEAQTFADNSSEYLEAVSKSFALSTRSQVLVHCYSTHLTKSEIVLQARALGVRLDLVWPCYLGGETPCGECESCKRFARAMQAVRI